jgi:hypothetical protein
MTVLQVGVPRSGNSLLYKALAGLHRQAGVPWRSYVAGHPVQQEARSWALSLDGQAQIDMISIRPAGCYLGISSAFQEPIADFDAFVRSCLVVWSHSPYDPRAADLFGAFDPVLYIVRDPRDALVSMAHFHYTEYSRQAHQVVDGNPASYLERTVEDFAWYWVKHVASFLAARRRLGLRVMFYEDLVGDLRAQLAELAGVLGLDLTPAALDELVAELDFGAMRASSPQHLRSGRFGQWRSELTADQAERADRIAGPMLDLLGYGRAARPDPAGAPALPDDLSAPTLRAVLAGAQAAAAGRATPGWSL